MPCPTTSSIFSLAVSLSMQTRVHAADLSNPSQRRPCLSPFLSSSASTRRCWLLRRMGTWTAIILVVTMLGKPTLATDPPCPKNIVAFNACPPWRIFQPSSSPSSHLGGFVDPNGDSLEWHCGHTSGLKLRQASPQVLVANLTANLHDGFSLSLWFQPGNTSLPRLQSILSISTREDDIDIAGCSQDLLQIGQYGEFLLLKYRDATEQCKIRLLRGSPLQETSLVKLSFTTDPIQSRTFSDGQIIDRSTGMMRLPEPVAHQTRQVRLFGSVNSNVDMFHGALYQLSFDNVTFSQGPVWWTNDTCYESIYTLPHYTIQAQTASPVLIPQGTNTSRTISLPWPETPSVVASVVSLPKHGRLSLDDGRDIAVASVFDRSTNLQYELTDPGFFSNPRINVHGVDLGLPIEESFAYEFQAFDDDGYLVAQSDAMELTIPVLLVNHRPRLYGPQKLTWSDNILQLVGMEIVDDDLDLILVRVDIECHRGRLTVAEEQARAKLQSYECSGRTASPWQCIGDGVADRRLIFVASPTDATHVMGHLTYTSLVPTRPQADNITITVYDGEGGECLTSSEHWDYQVAMGNTYPSIHPHGCISVPIVIPVSGQINHRDQPSDITYDGSSKWPDILFWVICIATILCACQARLRRCALRGTAVEADDEDDDGEDVDVDVNEGFAVSGVRVSERCGGGSVRNLGLDGRDDEDDEDSFFPSTYWDEISLA